MCVFLCLYLKWWRQDSGDYQPENDLYIYIFIYMNVYLCACVCVYQRSIECIAMKALDYDESKNIYFFVLSV